MNIETILDNNKAAKVRSTILVPRNPSATNFPEQAGWQTPPFATREEYSAKPPIKGDTGLRTTWRVEELITGQLLRFSTVG